MKTLDDFKLEIEEAERLYFLAKKRLIEKRIEASEFESGFKRGDYVMYKTWQRGFVDWLSDADGFPYLVFRPQRDCGNKKVDGKPSKTHYRIEIQNIEHIIEIKMPEVDIFGDEN